MLDNLKRDDPAKRFVRTVVKQRDGVALANREPARTQLLDHRGIGLDAPGLDASLAQQLEELASTAAEVGNRPRRRADEVLHVGGLG